ncbi:hypothetical protein [Candidatus Contubernalis alkaliaceticus]|uniref:hypothetical protein n=1 Tax=Candidatus Contubernalis alkaliaceticus TaxID=338645 RepID=UPI001F4BE17D|nr:hypothetical protein [Candidatus Contubernalis alkalaceticus]UNC91229.1 hypothetical protein HUE98_03475 [Candidatus Contubernalis alkalaceticus]
MTRRVLTANSLAFGAGVPIAFFVLNMLANVGEKYAWLGNLSLFTLLDPLKLLDGNSFTITANVIFLIVATVMYGGGILFFSRKNLPI